MEAGSRRTWRLPRLSPMPRIRRPRADCSGRSLSDSSCASVRESFGDEASVWRRGGMWPRSRDSPVALTVVRWSGYRSARMGRRASVLWVVLALVVASAADAHAAAGPADANGGPSAAVGATMHTTFRGAVLGGGLGLGSGSRGALGRLGGCSDSSPSSFPAPVPSAVAPPANVLSEFAILRGPATQDDLAAASAAVSPLGGVLSSYNAGYVRQLAPLPGGGSVFVVPGYLSQAGCGLDQTEQAEVSLLLGPGHPAATAPVYCLVQLQTGVEAFECALFAGVNTGKAFVGIVASSKPLVTDQVGLVPDGVSSVVLHYRASPPVPAAVSGNFFASRQSADPPALSRRIKELLARGTHRHGGLIKADERELERLALELRGHHTHRVAVARPRGPGHPRIRARTDLGVSDWRRCRQPPAAWLTHRP